MMFKRDFNFKVPLYRGKGIYVSTSPGWGLERPDAGWRHALRLIFHALIRRHRMGVVTWPPNDHRTFCWTCIAKKTKAGSVAEVGQELLYYRPQAATQQEDLRMRQNMRFGRI